eukprot:g7829.t1
MTRSAAVNLKELMLAVQQQKYEDRDKAAQREMSRNERCEGDRSIRHRDERRSRLLRRSIERRDFFKNWEREGRAKWNANQSALCRYERRLLNYELTVRATAQARQRISRARHSDDQADGVRWFEHNLDRLGLDPGGGGAGGRGLLLPDKETTATFRSRLVRAVLDQKFVPNSNAETMAELRFRGITGRRGRQEREHRRVKTEVDQRRAKAETDAQRAADRHLKGMLDEGRERRELAAACCEARHNLEEEVISDKKRCAEMVAAQEDAFETAFNLRVASTRARYEAESAERVAKADVLRARLQKDREEKRRRVEVMCAQVAHKMIDLAVVAADTRASRRGAPLPPTTWAHLKRWFCSPDPFFVDESPPEPRPVPADPALDAKTALERQNLDRYEGCWRLSGGLPPELTSEPCPLSQALSVARDLLEGPGKGPREPPTYGRRGRALPDGGDEETSVRLAVLGRRDGLGDLCQELGRWVKLYVCSLETALECALELGAEEARLDGKGKGWKGSVSGKRNSAGGDERGAADAALALEKAKEATMQKCFHPDSTEKDVEAFKAAAVAYHALRTHPKKASAPVPLATKTDLLVKHLHCRAPRGRGWVLVGYPGSLLESKLLENALSGYADDQVVAELGTGGKPSKPDTKVMKRSMIPPKQEEEAPAPLRSGLDAVLKLPVWRSAVPRRTNQEADWTAGVEAVEPAGATNEVEATKAMEDGGGSSQDEDEEHVGENGGSEQRDEQTAWWQGFEGGNLACVVPNEANDERLLETLFLLVNAAQNRKDDHNKWLADTASAQRRLEDQPDQALDGSNTLEPVAIKNLEAECPALSVVDWAANALFSFCGELRAPDDRWTTACLQLERQIEGWVTRMGETHAAVPNSRSRDGRAKRDGNGGCPAVASATPPAEGDTVWAALETFQLETGDVVDDRHCSAETTMREINAEADRKVRAWIGDIENAAADLCVAERTSYLETVETLRALDRLFGLEENHASSSTDRVREAARAAADALTKGMSPTPGDDLLWSDGGRLREEVRRTVQDVYHRDQEKVALSAREPRHDVSAHPLAGDRNQQAAFPSQRLGGIEEGTGSIGQGSDRSAEPLNNTTTRGSEPSVCAGSGQVERGRESMALATAIWRCRLTYVCRLRGIVMRLIRAVRGCEAKVSSMRGAVRRLKRRRVQLEHKGFSIAASLVRRALEECDHAIIQDILENGIPVWIEDDETFAADPCVALPWGMCGLGLPDVVDLARALSRSFESGPRGAEVAVSDLSRVVKAWSHSKATMNNRNGGGEELPQAWTGPSTVYIDTLCEATATAGGMNTGQVSWRRLLHALLLGHVPSLPTLDELRFMRRAFGLKASTASRPPTREALGRSPAAKGIDNAAVTASPAAQTLTLRIAQRHLSGIPFWFERQDHEAERGGERAGRDSWSSTIRAVYADAWGGDDGRVDGLDLLLTLCAVPGDAVVPDDGAEDSDGDEESGIPFSLGLFRAFSMLAETSLPSGTPTTNSGGSSSVNMATTIAAPPHGKIAATAGVPCVSLASLTAILEHGGGMAPADVAAVCELVVRKEEEAIRNQGSKVSPTATAGCSEEAANGKSEPAAGLEPDRTRDPTGEGAEATAGTPQKLHNELDGAHAAGDQSEELRDDRNRVAAAGSSTGAREGIPTVGQDQLVNQDQTALTISFTAVSECKAVREWVRRGAYTLPPFDVTSGRRRDIR